MVNGQAYIRTNQFTVIVREVNTPPVLNLPTTQSVNELAVFNLSAAATDADRPANPLTYSLIMPPAGMTINAANGAISWTPTEAQGPSTNIIIVEVADSNPWDKARPSLRTTNTFTVIVRELNLAPQLARSANQTADELAPFTVSAQVTDADVPANTFTFSLLAAPTGTAIEPSTGVISWTPTEVQGPGTNVITFRVQDSGAPSLSATNSFSVIVREMNTAPVFAAVPDQDTADNTTFRLTLRATDPDRPTNALTYALGDGAPAGAGIDPGTGELTWPIGVEPARRTPIIPVRVTDNGLPPLTAEQSVSVTIVPAVLRLAPLAPVEVDELALLVLNATVMNSPNALPPYAFEVEGTVPEGVSLNAASGVPFWRPGEAQGLSTKTFRIRVRDSASPPNTASGPFSILVWEVNQPPDLEAIANQTNAVGKLLAVTAEAADEDQPANGLTFSLGPDAPSGMTISPATGVIQWTPGAAFAGTTNRVTVRVTDDGTPAMEASRTFQAIVGGTAGIFLSVELIETGQARLRLSGDIGRTYLIEITVNFSIWSILTNFVSTAAITDIIEPLSATSGPRFYRAVSP